MTAAFALLGCWHCTSAMHRLLVQGNKGTCMSIYDKTVMYSYMCVDHVRARMKKRVRA
jgi:hypothetical protein